ncbi:MAG: hypothetical protein KIH10_17660, partial [Candidatus Freyarchaeota archaeon]|nr:hypothetical protein [Candidatus Jordarchaeia archaeon]
MVKANKKKCVLGLTILLALLLVMAIPILSLKTPATFPPQTNIFTNTQTQPNLVISKENPQPQPNLWWNYSYTFRQEINVTEPGYTDRINEPAIVHLTFTYGWCHKNSTKLTYYNDTTASWVKLPSQIVNATYSGDYITSCDLIFPANVTKRGTSTYYLYYNNTFGDAEPEPSPLSINKVGDTFTFNTGVISGYYQAYSPDLTYDDDASFQQFIINGLNIIPTSGLHKGIDRIDADDNGRFHLGNQLNWTINIIENGPIRAIVRVNKTSTDNFTSSSGVGDGSYGPMNKTYTFYAYTGIVRIEVECNVTTVPIYDFATIAVDSSWDFYVDNNNLGTATNIHFTDKKAGVQPQNYMTLVRRTDGIGLGLLGSPLWPWDINNGTSIEYGLGIDSGSFGVRNDRRDGQAGIKFPFTYYVVGLTGGFNESVKTWYQVNHPVTCVPGNEYRKFYPLYVNVTDNFGNAIVGANVTIYDSAGPTGYNTSGTTDLQGLCLFRLFENYTADQYWIQAYVNASYANYSSQAVKWNPKENFTEPGPSTLDVSMNITSVYVEVWDKYSKVRVQNANVTLNYTDGAGNISQFVNEFYANCSFYAYAYQNITIDIYVETVWEEIYKIYFYGNTTEVSQPINITEPMSFLVELNRSVNAYPTQLTCVNGSVITGTYWSDNITFYVWLNRTGGGNPPLNVEWMNYTIKDINSVVVVNSTSMSSTGTTGLCYATFNTSVVGLEGGNSYVIIVTGNATSDGATYLLPTPISIFLTLEKLPVDTIVSSSSINTTWSSPASFSVWLYLNDTHRSLPVEGASVNYTISGTEYINQPMPMGASGNYSIPQDVLSGLVPGSYSILVSIYKGNYSIPNTSISLNIYSIATSVIVPSSVVSGFYDQNITIYVVFQTANPGSPIHNASVSWVIKDMGINGTMEEMGDTGNYTGMIPALAVPPGAYSLIISAGKQNYTTTYSYLVLEISSIQTVLAPSIFTMLPLGSTEYILMGSFIQIENSLPILPIIVMYTDHNGAPVSNATVMVTGGLPAFQVSPGMYLILVPTSGLPPSTLMLGIQSQATNYQSQQIPIILSIKERTIALFPGIRIPVSVFLITLAAILIPSSLFLTYTAIKRARIPAIIKRIDELIRAISRGEKVTVKLIPREKVIAKIIREELAIVGVEPRVEKYLPMELADLIVPLLVESGIKEKEAYALVSELKTATPSERERLLESVGVPGEISAKIIQ